MQRLLTIYTDGAARGNPGPSASGFIAVEDGKVIGSEFRPNGKKTNNYAEYAAMIMGLEWCAVQQDPGSIRVLIRSDSELVVRQARGEYRVKAHGLRALNRRLAELASRFAGVDFQSLPRENRMISRVDRELNLLLDRG